MRRLAPLVVLLLLAPAALAQDPGEPAPSPPPPEAPPPTCQDQANAASGLAATARAGLDQARADTLRGIVGAPPLNLTPDEQRASLRILSAFAGQFAGLLAPFDYADLSACAACPPPQSAGALLASRAESLAADAQAFVTTAGAAAVQATLRRAGHGLQDLHGLAHAWLDERIAALAACSTGSQAPQGPLACLAAALPQRADPAPCLAAAGEAWRRGPGAAVANRTATVRLGHVEAEPAKAQFNGLASAWRMRPEPVAAVQHLATRGVPVVGAFSGVGSATVQGDGAARTLAGDRTEARVQDGGFLRLDARCDLTCHLTLAPGVRMEAAGANRWTWTAGPLRGGIEATGQVRSNGTWIEVTAGRLALWSLGPSLILPTPEAWTTSDRLLGVAIGVPSAQEAGDFGLRTGVARLRPHEGGDGFTVTMDLPRAGCVGTVADARLFDAGALGQVANGQLTVRLDRGDGTDELPAASQATLLRGGAGWAFEDARADGAPAGGTAGEPSGRVRILACGDAPGAYRLVANTAGAEGAPAASLPVALVLLGAAALCRRPKWRGA